MRTTGRKPRFRWAILHPPAELLDRAALLAARQLAHAVAIDNASELIRGDFDGLIVPCGDRLPAELFQPIIDFRTAGGAVLWVGGVPFRKPVFRRDRWRPEWNERVLGIPTWQHLMAEDLDGTSLNTLIERLGVAFNFLRSAEVVTSLTTSATELRRYLARVDVRSIPGLASPLGDARGFKSIISAATNLDPGLSAAAVAFVTVAGFGAYCAPLPDGEAGRRIVRVLADQLMLVRRRKPAIRERVTQKCPRELPEARIAFIEGKAPSVVINGKGYWPGMYEFDLTARALRESVKGMAASGCRIFKPCSFHVFPTWTGDDTYEYEWFDMTMRRCADAISEGFLIPHINLTPPPWWFDVYPDEVRVNDVISESPRGSVIRYGESPIAPSLSSSIWRRQIIEAVSHLVCHIKQSDYASRVIGIHVAYGAGSEWIEQAWDDNRFVLGDWNPQSERAFAEFAARESSAWARKRAAVPDRADRLVSDAGVFLDSAKAHRVSLWYQFLACQATTLLDGVSHAIKKQSDDRMLVGAFAGYLFGAGRCAYLHADAISSALSRYLALRHIDYLETPYGYDLRGIDGDCTFRGCADVLPLHRKLYVNQNDQRTDRHLPASFGIARSSAESAEVVKRNVGHAIVRKAGTSWYDFGLGWFDDPAYRATCKKLWRLGDRSLRWDGGDVPGLGVIVDDRYLAYQRMANPLVWRLQYEQMNEVFSRTGIAWTVHHLRDVLSGTVATAHKAWLVLNCFYLTSLERRKLRRNLARDGNTVIWQYAPGFQSEEGMDAGNICDLVGMRIRQLDVVTSDQVNITNFSDALTSELLKPATFGARDTDDKSSFIEPLFYVDDRRATMLGMFEAVGRCGYAVRRFGNWTSIYIGAAKISADVLRSMARAASAHIYMDCGDVLYAGSRLIVHVAMKAGEVDLRLPTRSDVRDAMTGRRLASGATSVRLPRTPHVTTLLEVHPTAGS